jgi:hypothetical protein
VEVASLRYARAERSNDFGGPGRHLLADSAQPAEFVRFSALGSAEALVYPNPEAHFSPVINFVFAGLTRATYHNPEHLLTIDPVRMRRRDNQEWEMA